MYRHTRARAHTHTHTHTQVPGCRGFDTQCPHRAARKVNSKASARMGQRHACWQASACDFNSPCLSQLYGFVELEVHFFLNC